MQKMKILLGDPRHNTRGLHSSHVPIGIGYIGEFLRAEIKKDANVELKLATNPEEIFTLLEDWKPDIIGLSNYVWNSSLSNSICKYAKKINSSYAQFSVFTPYPGTPAFNEYKDKITKNKYEDFTQWQLVFRHQNLTEKDVLYLLNYSYKKYYLNHKWAIRFLFNKIKDFYENLHNRLFGFSR